ncbi:MAG: hypothetical protein HDR24_10505 [Lachnospiraceae bacterium]|nr:hypothetical protein [Lachnospiraceae bacterium]
MEVCTPFQGQWSQDWYGYLSTLAGLFVLATFDKDRLKALIEKVVVYGEDAMEIVWKVRNPFDSEVSV